MDQTLRSARAEYFAENGFSDAGYDDAWVRLPIGPVALVLPNLPGRRRAVPRHDIHHVLTEYPTTWQGEFCISAWEVASGCGNYWMAWIINLQGLALGTLFCPRLVARAYERGRRSSNLYITAPLEPLLDKPMGEVRRQIHIPPPAAVASAGTIVHLAAWVTFVAVIHFTPLVLVGAWLLY